TSSDVVPPFLTSDDQASSVEPHDDEPPIVSFKKEELVTSPDVLYFARTAIGCAVNKGIQDGLRAGIDHGKAGRDLSIVEAYDPSAEAKYIEAVNAFDVVDFSLLSELNSKKDASIVVSWIPYVWRDLWRRSLEQKIFNLPQTNSGFQSIGPKIT
nr:hypothetical protein [Tanacetum cinerariifolium]